MGEKRSYFPLGNNSPTTHRTHSAGEIRVWEWLQQHRIEDEEDGSVGTDAQRQSEHHGRRETPTVAEHAEGEAEVAEQGSA
jgi:hypothetical protein